tara:strand:+ start:209 stop:466 length:258 start_codon:yes stop_codon:yes gene_type:complete
MDALVHTFLAVGTMFGAFYAGKHIGRLTVPDKFITFLLDKLEKDGYILTETDKDGEKELIPVSEVIAKALREASKISSKNAKEGF